MVFHNRPPNEKSAVAGTLSSGIPGRDPHSWSSHHDDAYTAAASWLHPRTTAYPRDGVRCGPPLWLAHTGHLPYSGHTMDALPGIAYWPSAIYCHNRGVPQTVPLPHGGVCADYSISYRLPPVQHSQGDGTAFCSCRAKPPSPFEKSGITCHILDLRRIY